MKNYLLSLFTVFAILFVGCEKEGLIQENQAETASVDNYTRGKKSAGAFVIGSYDDIQSLPTSYIYRVGNGTSGYMEYDDDVSRLPGSGSIYLNDDALAQYFHIEIEYDSGNNAEFGFWTKHVPDPSVCGIYTYIYNVTQDDIIRTDWPCYEGVWWDFYIQTTTSWQYHNVGAVNEVIDWVIANGCVAGQHNCADWSEEDDYEIRLTITDDLWIDDIQYGAVAPTVTNGGDESSEWNDEEECYDPDQVEIQWFTTPTDLGDYNYQWILEFDSGSGYTDISTSGSFNDSNTYDPTYGADIPSDVGTYRAKCRTYENSAWSMYSDWSYIYITVD